MLPLTTRTVVTTHRCEAREIVGDLAGMPCAARRGSFVLPIGSFSPRLPWRYPRMEYRRVGYCDFSHLVKPQ